LRDSDIAISGLSWIEREAAMANRTGESESDAVRLDFDGMLVFPDLRYTYANLLVLMSGAATWLAYLPGTLRRGVKAT
jgi:hypothetical protein